MKHTSIIVAVGLALTVALPAVSALAQNTRSFVSPTGSDSNPCTLSLPCRGFQAAHDATNAGGEVAVLGTAGYGTLTINKAISIVNPGAFEAGVLVPSGGVGITINAGPNDAVSLRGLTIEGGGVGGQGIQFNTGKLLAVDDCVIRHMISNGIAFAPTASSKLTVSNSKASDNGGDGIYVQPTGNGGNALAVFNRVEANNNVQNGIAVFANLNIGSTNASIFDSSAAINGGTGILVAASGIAMGIASLTVHNSVSVNNGTGISAQGPVFFYIGHSKVAVNGAGWVNQGFLTSYGDNYFDLNGANTGVLAAATRL